MTKEIPLTQGKVALVDDADYEWLMQRKWCIQHGYAKRCVRSNGRNHTIMMAREIMSAPPDMEVDHIDRDKLNNRRSNLRVCTHRENVRNSKKNPGNLSNYIGVNLDKLTGKYNAHLRVDGHRLHLGSFADPIEAAHARDSKARELHGEFAVLNFPDL